MFIYAKNVQNFWNIFILHSTTFWRSIRIGFFWYPIISQFIHHFVDYLLCHGETQSLLNMLISDDFFQDLWNIFVCL